MRTLIRSLFGLLIVVRLLYLIGLYWNSIPFEVLVHFTLILGLILLHDFQVCHELFEITQLHDFYLKILDSIPDKICSGQLMGPTGASNLQDIKILYGE